MKIYTRKGDRGETSLFGGKRTAKDSLRIEAYGSVDELNAVLGAVRALKPHHELDSILATVQNELFVLGADLATPKGKATKNVPRIEEQHIVQLEQDIDRLEASLTPLRSFIVPGGSSIAVQLHIARTVCRRAERHLVRLSKKEKIGETPVKFLNRLSDLLFVLARYANKVDGVQEMPWKPSE